MPESLLNVSIVSLLVAVLAVPGPGAPDQRSEAPDCFFEGLAFQVAGRIPEAMELLQYETGNPCFELVRRSIRARILLADSLRVDALAEARAALDTVRCHPFLAAHPSAADAAECWIRATECAGAAQEALAATDALALQGRVPAGAYLACADMLLSRGEGAEALAAVRRGLAAKQGPGDAADLARLIDRPDTAWAGFPASDLGTLARRAVELGLSDEAESIVSRLAAAGSGGGETSLIAAMILERRGRSDEAASLYRSLASAGGGKRVAQEACLRLAALELSKKRYDRAVERYRAFASRWPRDERSARSLDTAARIEISLGRREEALALWKGARARGISMSCALDAALSEAALRSALGQNEAASSILRRIEPAAPAEMRPAILYWLARSSRTEEERSRWRLELETEHPRSFAAVVARGDGAAGGSSPAPAERLAAMARFEHVALDSLLDKDSLDDSIVSHPLARAMRACEEHRLPREAARWALVLARHFMLDGEGCAILRVEARREGIWLDMPGAPAAGASLWILDHPVILTDEVAAAGEEHGVAPELVLAVARVESRFDDGAVSRAGARGLMQLMPETAAWVDELRGAAGDSTSLFDPRRNIDAGSWYLARLLDRCGSIVAALAAYNAGEGATARWRKNVDASADPMLAIEMIGQRETRGYVRRVLDSYAAYCSMTDERLALR